MNYMDRSSALQGLSKFPGANLDGCLSVYNRFYDTYLDRARLIYGDTTVTDVTPDSVVSTLRSRYIASIDQLYLGRDQFVRLTRETVALDVSLKVMKLYAMIAPCGPKDLACIIFGCLGDGIDIDHEDINNGFFQAFSGVILRDSVWGHVFDGRGSDLEDGFRADWFYSEANRVPSWNSGTTNKSCAISTRLVARQKTVGYVLQSSLTERHSSGTEIHDIEFSSDTGRDIVPTSTSAAKRFQFLNFEDKIHHIDFNGESGLSTHENPVNLRSPRSYSWASSQPSWDPRGNFIIDSSGDRSFVTTQRDYLSLISAALLAACM